MPSFTVPGSTFGRVLAVTLTAVVASSGLAVSAAAAPAGGNQVITPVHLGPRGPQAPIPAGAMAYVDPDDLTIVTHEADGGGSIALYEARPEIGGGQGVLNSLKAKGVVSNAISVRSTPAAGAGVAPAAAPQPGPTQVAAQCPSGYWAASYWATDSSCATRVRWARNGYAHPQVYYHDHTSSAWPVHASVDVWNEAYGVDSHYAAGGCPGGGTHCVEVWNATYQANWYGYTYVRFDSSGYFIDGTVAVFFDDWQTNGYNRMTTCHELGHTLGLGHNTSYNSNSYSCLWSSTDNRQSPPNVQTPSQADFDTLANVIYNN